MAKHVLKTNPIPFVAQNLKQMIKIIVENEDDVLIHTYAGKKRVEYTVYVNKEDRAKLIGDNEETIMAIRKVLTSWCDRYNFYAVLEVEE